MIESEATPAVARPTPASADAHPDGNAIHERVIRPTSGWRAVNWEEMYEFRELLGNLVWRDVAARYKQSVLGPAWAIIQPVIMVSIFTVLTLILRVSRPGGLPAPVLIFAGLIPWTIFSQGMPAAANSLINSLNMVTKVYFPRLFLPFAAASVFLVDGILSTMVYGAMLAIYRIPPHWTVVFIPVFFLLTLLASLGMGVALAAVTVFFRDFKHIVPFIVQIMMYATPIFWQIGNIPENYRWLIPVMSLNPMFGITDGFRAAVLGLPIQWGSLLISATSALVLFTFAIHYFRRNERIFADYV